MESENHSTDKHGIRIKKQDNRIIISDGGVRIKHEDKPIEIGQSSTHLGILDLLFLFDTTGSMYVYLEEVRSNLVSIVREIHQEIPQARIAIMAHGDHCDEKDTYLVKSCSFKINTGDLVSFIRGVEPTDGGDAPEAIEDALWEANRLSWSHESGKALIIVGDSTPHDTIDCPYHRNYRAEAEKLRAAGVKFYSVWCPESDSASSVFRWLATMSGGRFLPLKNITDLCDLLVAVAMKEVGKLDVFRKRLELDNRITDSKALLLKGLGDD